MMEFGIPFSRGIMLRFDVGVSKNRDTPKWMVYKCLETLLKWLIWGVPLFLETPMSIFRGKNTKPRQQRLFFSNSGGSILVSSFLGPMYVHPISSPSVSSKVRVTNMTKSWGLKVGSCWLQNSDIDWDVAPLKFNIAPEKWWLEDYFPIGKVTFQGLC